MATTKRRPKNGGEAVPTNPQPKTEAPSARDLFLAEKAKRAQKVAAAKPKGKTDKDEPNPEKPTHNKAGRRLATGLTCLCGCGAPTQTKKARFISGHDAKLRKLILGYEDGAEAWNNCPDIIRPFYLDGEEVAGLALVEEDGEYSFEDRKPNAAV